MILREIIHQIFSDALSKLAGTKLDARIEIARDANFGDYACTSAMDNQVREACGIKNPRELAAQLIANLDDRKDKYFKKIEIAGPGFINITLRDDFLFSFISTAHEQGANYGSSKIDNPENIIFEFVSANPTGPLNIVSARAAALGDSCCNLLQAVGHKVNREYYVNDYGNQVRLLGISCLFRILEKKGIALKFIDRTSDTVQYNQATGLPFPKDAYHGEYIIDVITKINAPEIPPAEIDRLNTLSKTDLAEADIESKILNQTLGEIAAKLGEAAINEFLKSHQSDLLQFRVSFDQFFKESSLHKEDKVMPLVQELGEYVYTENNKKVFASSQFGDDKDRVIVREDGRPTYLLADIAYHQTKIKRNFTKIIDIWGPDHHGYIARLTAALKVLGYKDGDFQVLIAQQVNLLDHGQPVVMSKRTGKIITLNELINEIPIDVVRYFFVMRSFESHLDFDLAEAADTSDKNPYYYVAYAHARIQSILDKATATITDKPSKQDPADIDWTDERRRLMLMVARLPEEVKEAATEFSPHRLVSFLYQTATAVSRFYGMRENKIIELDAKTALVLISVLKATGLCLKNGLRLLGMQAPDRLERESDDS